MGQWFRNNFDGGGLVLSVLLFAITVPLIVIGSYHMSKETVHGEYYISGENGGTYVCQQASHAVDSCINFNGLSAQEVVNQTIRLNQARKNL